MILIIDYDMGNVGSIKNILHRIGANDVVISNRIEDIQNAQKFILPGVGAFDTGMDNLEKFHVIDELHEQVVLNKKPLLGICLGMQLLGRKSEEGQRPGLGWIPFDTVKFKIDEKYAIPHMGWDYVSIEQQDTKLVKGLDKEKHRYYFVHSYHAKCDSAENSLMICDYGYKFSAAVVKDNIYGVQFHPEKSHKYGMKLLQNFVEM
jgi:glutamine amidotransferase